MPRIQRRFLHRSRWTSLVRIEGSEGERHFEIVEAPRGDRVTLRAVLTQRDYEIGIDGLDDASAWALGWQPIPDQPG
ncbi:MAG: TIGR02450 family Trp-rich protein [Deltaproteobacteria bacterium]|nr:TIGR02450 family Trp-rich protein [Nannocystaceae bacterium]